MEIRSQSLVPRKGTPTRGRLRYERYTIIRGVIDNTHCLAPGQRGSQTRPVLSTVSSARQRVCTCRARYTRAYTSPVVVALAGGGLADRRRGVSLQRGERAAAAGAGAY
jgi:hypothetical protein